MGRGEVIFLGVVLVPTDKAIVNSNAFILVEDLYTSLRKYEFYFFTNESIRYAVVLLNFDDIQYILHFDLPLYRNIFINRVERKQVDELPNTIAITYSTDIELNMIRKVELGVGRSMEIVELPEDLIIEGSNRLGKEEDGVEIKRKKTTSIEEYILGAAFHVKKESNLKDYNYNYKDKRKMAGKKSKRRDS